MKTCIVTMNSSYNYGAMLQAYALQQKLLSMGIESAFVDRRTIREAKVHIDGGLTGLIKAPFVLLNKKALTKAYRSCESFVNDYQIITENNYSDYNKLKANPPEADVYITGSDQVWNTSKCVPANFLDFVPDGKKKISYAASMGINRIVEDKKEQVKAYLSDFSSISVREVQAAESLKEVTDKPVNVHIDPVFLLTKNEWKKIENPREIPNKPYILCYILFRPKWLNQKLKEIHNATGKDIVVVDMSAYRNVYHTKMIRSAGPREFLSLLRHADGVVTSSFHGTALSVVYHKPFYSIVNPASPSRIGNLLDLLNLSGRVLQENTTDFFQEKVDFSYADSVIGQEQKRATDYLRQNIGV